MGGSVRFQGRSLSSGPILGLDRVERLPPKDDRSRSNQGGGPNKDGRQHCNRCLAATITVLPCGICGSGDTALQEMLEGSASGMLAPVGRNAIGMLTLGGLSRRGWRSPRVPARPYLGTTAHYAFATAFLGSARFAGGFSSTDSNWCRSFFNYRIN